MLLKNIKKHIANAAIVLSLTGLLVAPHLAGALTVDAQAQKTITADYSTAYTTRNLTNDFSTQATLARLYLGVLDRLPDQEGAAYWTGAVQEGAATMNDVGTLIASSQEFHNKYGTTDHDIVWALYANVLNRAPDTEGFNYWMGILQTHEVYTVVFGFTESQEFRNSLGWQDIHFAFKGAFDDYQTYQFTYNISVPTLPDTITPTGSSATLTKVSTNYHIPANSAVYNSTNCYGHWGFAAPDAYIKDWAHPGTNFYACVDTTPGRHTGAARDGIVRHTTAHEIAHLWQFANGDGRLPAHYEQLADCIAGIIDPETKKYAHYNPTSSFCTNNSGHVDQIVNQMRGY